MWIPKTEDEIIRAVSSGSLEESTTFDAKESLPDKNVEIAKDIAAMCNDGGVIIYGIGEDENKRLTRLTPVPIKGQAERIASIIQSAISEPPKVFINEPIPFSKNPSLGFIVVEIPPSERAPHMVVVKGEYRYYGRGAKGNVPLSEGDVARLYERRKRTEADLDALLEKEISNSYLSPNPNFSYFHLIVHPTISLQSILPKIEEPNRPLLRVLSDLVDAVIEEDPLQGNYRPRFNPYISRWEHIPEGARGKISVPQNPQSPGAPGDTLVVDIENNGTGHLFCGRAAENKQGSHLFFPKVVIGNALCYLLFLGKIYDKSGYIGMVDIGLGITGLRGSVIQTDDRVLSHVRQKFEREQYQATKRISAKSFMQIMDVVDVVEDLLSPLIKTMTQGRHDEFLNRIFGERTT
jgi:hypothetical protein